MPAPSKNRRQRLRNQVLRRVQAEETEAVRQVGPGPKWCPRRIAPPACRIHGFKDERSAHMDLLWRIEYVSGRMKTISPAPFHYGPRTEIRLGMTARQFYDASQENPLRDVLPEEVCDGEIIEIDDGLQPYYFYVLDCATVVPLPYFRFLPSNRKK